MRGKKGSKDLARRPVGHKGVKKIRLGINSGILFQECFPFVVASLLLGTFIYLFIHFIFFIHVSSKDYVLQYFAQHTE